MIPRDRLRQISARLDELGALLSEPEASGSADFDENGDVSGVFAVNVVGDHGKWAKELLK